MKNTIRLRSFLALAGSSLLAISSAQAVTYYWDTNSTTAGLGDTAGTWGSSALFRTLDAAASRGVINGTLATFATQNGASGDTFYFGTANLGLGTTASTIGTTGILTTTNLVIGAGQTNNITFSAGGTITLAGTTPTIAVNNASNTTTIAAILGGTVGMTKAGSGTLVLTNAANSLTGGVIIRDGGRLNLGNGTSGGFTATTNALTFNNGGGTFNLAQASAGSQTMGALTFSGGDGSVISTAASGAATQTLTFSSLAARAAGATGNFSLVTNTTAADNRIVLTGAATGFLDKGLFFGGSSYAAYDGTGYVRGLIYGTDTNAAVSGTITASNHVQLTASPAARTGDTLLSLNLSGGGVDYTMNTGSLSVPAILKSGGGAVSTISGGTSLTTAGNAELVIRTDTASDLLTISSAVTGFSGGLTKTGAGTLNLSGGNSYTGATRINAGILAVSGGSAIANNQAVVLANAAGATFQLNASETILNVTGGGFTGGNVNVQGNTLTLADATSYSFGGQFTGTSAGSVVKQGAGTLTLSNKNTFAGTISLEAGALEFSYGNDGSGAIIALSSGGAINMANGTTLRFSPSINLLSGTVGDSLGAVNGGTPAYPYGWTVTNDINIASGTTTANIRVGGNENSIRFSGNVTGGTSGAQTLAIFAGGINTGNGDRQPNVFSGTIANGVGGTLGVNVDFAGASGAAQGIFVSLSGQNTFTGPIVVTNTKGMSGAGANGGYLGIGGEIHSTGPVFINGTGTLGSGNYTNTISLATGTKLAYLSSANQTLGGIISGDGELIKRGSGTLTLSAANGFTGATTITEGTLNLGGGTANGSLASTVLNMGGTTLNYTRTGSSTQAFTTTNITAGANTITAVAGNTLTLGTLARTGAATVNFGTTGTITTSTANDASGILGGWATFGGTNWAVANGAGSAITGYATYTMTSSVLNAGASYNGVNIGVDSSQAPNAAITSNTLTFNTAGAYTLTLLAASTNTIPGILVNSTVGNNASLITGGTALRGTNNGTLNIIQNNTNALGALTIGSIIANNGTSGLNKSGAGTLILTNANTYTGTTFIGAGTLQIGNGGATGTLAATSAIVNNSSLVINQGTSQTLAAISGTGSVTLTASTGLTLSNSNSFSGGFTLNGGIVGAIPSGTFGGFGSGTVNINGGRMLFGSGAIATITNAMNWNANFSVDRGASSTPTITWAGPITLGANVTMSGSAAGGAYIHNFNGGILDDMTGNRSLAFTTVGGGGRQFVTLNGNNTFTGNISITQGSLTIGGSGKLGGGDYSGNISISAFATAPITYSSSSDQILRGTISVASSLGLTKDTSSTSVLTLSGTNTYTGATNVTAGTLSLGHATDTLSSSSAVTVDGATAVLSIAGNSDTVGVVSLKNGGSITGSGGTLTGASYAVESGSVSAKLGGTGIALTKSTAGTVTLTGVNTYTGSTTVSAGKLIVNGNISTSITTVASTATLGGAGTVGALTVQSGGFVTPGNSPGILTVNGNYIQAGQYTAEIAGTTAGNLATNHDQINVSGTVNITGGTLVTQFSAGTYALNDLIFILLNDSTEAITGTYATFAQGAVVATFGGFDWQISYSANGNNTGSPSFTGGNDIALMAIPEPNVAAMLGGLGVLALLRRRR